jgi:hypothetical protein
MTSNPKPVQNGQRSSPSFLAFWVRKGGRDDATLARSGTSTTELLPFGTAIYQ